MDASRRPRINLSMQYSMQPHHLVKAILFVLLIIFFVMIGGTYLFYNTVKSAQANTLYENLDDAQKAETADYENCILLEKKTIVRISEGQKQVLPYAQAREILTRDTARMNHPRFRIIVTPGIDYQNLSDILLLMTELKMKNYILLKS